jgi:hypothetical protein
VRRTVRRALEVAPAFPSMAKVEGGRFSPRPDRSDLEQLEMCNPGACGSKGAAIGTFRVRDAQQ